MWIWNAGRSLCGQVRAIKTVDGVTEESEGKIGNLGGAARELWSSNREAGRAGV